MATLPRVLLTDRLEWLPYLGGTGMGGSYTDPGDGTQLAARVRPGESRRKTAAGEIFIEVAQITLDTEPGVGDRLALDAGAGQVLHVRTVKPIMGRTGPMGWKAGCSE